MKRTSVLFLLLSAVTLLTAGAAHATHWNSFEATADCDGFAVNGSVRVGSVDSPYIEIPYEIQLTQGGMVVEEFTGSVQAYFQLDPDLIEVSASFATDLQGDYTVAGVFTLPRADQGDPEATFSIDVQCGDPVDPEDPCETCEVFTAAYWFGNLNEWPLDSVLIGGVSYSQDQLAYLVNGCSLRFAVKSLLRQLVAAELNVALGCGEYAPEDVMAEAHALFADNGVQGCWNWCERINALQLAGELLAYNMGLTLPDCDDGGHDCDCPCHDHNWWWGGHQGGCSHSCDGHHGGSCDGHHDSCGGHSGGHHGGHHGGHGGGCKTAEKDLPQTFTFENETVKMSDLKELYR